MTARTPQEVVALFMAGRADGGHIGFRVFPNQCGTLVRITVPTEQNRRESV